MPSLFFKRVGYILAAIFLVSFMVTLWSALLLPVYMDEIQWKMTVSRYFLDGGKLIYLFPACEKGWLLATPISWYPGRILDGWIYGDASSPEKLRNYGCGIFILLLLIWTWIFSKVSKLSKINCFLFISAFFSIGMLPYLMVFNRPEQSLLLWVSLGLVSNFLINPDKNWPFITRVLVLIGYIILGFLIASSHPKGLYLLPLMLLVYWRLERSLIFRFVYFLAILFSAYETFSLWRLRTVCDESFWLTKIIKEFTIQPQLAVSDPVAFIQSGIENLQRWRGYFEPLAFHSTYPSEWFVGTPFVLNYPKLFWIISYGVPYLAIGILVFFLLLNKWGYLLVKIYYHIKIKKQQFQWAVTILIAIVFIIVNQWQWAVVIFTYMLTPMYSGRWVFFKRPLNHPISQEFLGVQAGIFLAIFGLSFMQTFVNFYEASLMWPLVLLFFIYSTAKLNPLFQRALLSYLLPLFLIIGISFSIIRIVITWDSPIMQLRPPISKQENLEKIKLFAKNECGVSELAYPLIIDDKTYPAFWDRPFPMHVAYVVGWWSTGTVPSETIKKREPQGMIISCDSTNAKHSQDGVCCLSKEELMDKY